LKQQTQKQVQIEPVHSYPVPGYPMQAAFYEQNNIGRHIPRRWRCRHAVGRAVLFSVITGLCSCLHTDGGTEAAAKTYGEIQREYGQDHCGYSCIGTMLPVRLTEEESAQIVRETAGKYGPILFEYIDTDTDISIWKTEDGLIYDEDGWNARMDEIIGQQKTRIQTDLQILAVDFADWLTAEGII